MARQARPFHMQESFRVESAANLGDDGEIMSRRSLKAWP